MSLNISPNIHTNMNDHIIKIAPNIKWPDRFLNIFNIAFKKNIPIPTYNNINKAVNKLCCMSLSA